MVALTIRDDRAMREPATIREEIFAAVTGALGADSTTLSPHTSLYDDLGADSLTVMEIVARLEERLEIELPDSNEFVSGLRTVGDLLEAFAGRARKQ
jgi:acyl carrier protein